MCMNYTPFSHKTGLKRVLGKYKQISLLSLVCWKDLRRGTFISEVYARNLFSRLVPCEIGQAVQGSKRSTFVAPILGWTYCYRGLIYIFADRPRACLEDSGGKLYAMSTYEVGHCVTK